MPKVTEQPVVREVADRLGATPAQVGLAWLLARDPHVLLIPGTSSRAHLEENVAASQVELDAEALSDLEGLRRLTAGGTPSGDASSPGHDARGRSPRSPAGATHTRAGLGPTAVLVLLAACGVVGECVRRPVTSDPSELGEQRHDGQARGWTRGAGRGGAPRAASARHNARANDDELEDRRPRSRTACRLDRAALRHHPDAL